MKKLLLSIVAMLAFASMQAQNVNMYILVGNTTDIKNIPVTLYVDNDVEITGLQATFAIPDVLTKTSYVFDEDEETYFSISSRATKNHKKNSKELFKASKPNDLSISIVSDNGSMIKDNSGEMGTFWFDGSSLADGTYSVKLYDACVFPDANSRIDAAGQHTPEQSADYKPFEFVCTFTLANGAVTCNIKNVSAATKVGGIYNVAGQQMNNLQKGINIVDGKKIFVK